MHTLPDSTVNLLLSELKKFQGKEAALKAELAKVQKSIKAIQKMVKGASQNGTV